MQFIYKEPDMKKNLLWLIVVVCVAGCYRSEYTVKTQSSWDFENAKSETLPPGWLAAQTAGKTPLATWQIAGDSWGKTIAVVQSPNTGDTHNLLLASPSRVANLRLSAKLRATSGKESQGGGIVWRALNPQNYYLACWEPLDGKLRLGFVEAGKFVLLQSVPVEGDSTSWHTIEVEHFRDSIKVFMDGVFLIEQQDNTLMYPGMIGLLTQADACTMFDDVKVEEIR
jgi:hypothetical protein